jgi:predicted O-methyltransferase YrrM
MISKKVEKQFKKKFPDYLLPGGTLFEDDDLALLKYGKGVVLEVGTFLGLSATILSINAKKVYTIDQFIKNNHMKCEKYNYKDVKKDLSKFKNIEVIKGYSKDIIIDKKFDVVFLDGGHCQPVISEDYVKWSGQLKSGGYLLFHDCVDIYPDIIDLCNKIKHQNFMEFIEKIGIINIFRKY